MANTVKLDTPIERHHTGKVKGPDTPPPCCKNPRTHGYPEEDPVVQICLTCGSWNWENY
jgi:hypothetical protein